MQGLNWTKIEVGDALYDAGTPKWAADAYGHHDLSAAYLLSLTGPDSHTQPTYWTITRTPNTNTIGSRFVATWAHPTESAPA